MLLLLLQLLLLCLYSVDDDIDGHCHLLPAVVKFQPWHEVLLAGSMVYCDAALCADVYGTYSCWGIDGSIALETTWVAAGMFTYDHLQVGKQGRSGGTRQPTTAVQLQAYRHPQHSDELEGSPRGHSKSRAA